MGAYRKRSAIELRALNLTIDKILDHAQWKKENNIWYAKITYYKNGEITSLTRNGSIAEWVRRVLWDHLINMGKSGAKLEYRDDE